MGKYSKFIIAIVGAVATVLAQQYADNATIAAILPFLTAVGVYAKANTGV